MTHAVLTTSVGSVYDDLPEFRYHFPKTYLDQAKAAEGDWIVYYEPRRSHGGGRQSYIGMARIKSVVADLQTRDHYYAYMEGYLEFDHPVPFTDGGDYPESALRKADGTTNKGAFGRSVRPLPGNEFEAIVRAGFTRQLEPWEEIDAALAAQTGVEDLVPCPNRPVVEQVVSRPFRDEAFRRKIRKAYQNTCAVSGLSLINGGGRPEVQAAHIRPVAFNGPDSIRNGLALTGTLHWLFDRGLIAIGADLGLLLSPQGLPDDLPRLLRPERKIWVPEAPEERPHPEFLSWHRKIVFKT
jgi:putative restriction endonuclease